MQTNHRTSEYTYVGMAGVVTANIGWGITDVCIAIIGQGLVVTWLHGTLGAVFALTLMAIMRERFVWRDFLNSFPIGLHRSIVWGVLFIAFQEDNPSIAVTILSFSVILSIVVFGPMLGEKVNPFIVTLAGIGAIGIVLTSNKSLTQFEFSRGALIALIVLPMAGAGTFILRKVLQKVPGKTSAPYMYLWIAIIYLPIAPFLNADLNFTRHEIFILFTMTVLGAGGHFLFAHSQARTTFRFNQIASIVHIPATAIFTWWFIGGTLKLHQILGMAIVIFVVAYLSIATRPKVDQVSDESLALEP